MLGWEGAKRGLLNPEIRLTPPRRAILRTRKES